MNAELVVELGERPAWRSVVVAVSALRPRQWTKNLLLFAGIVFAAKLGDGTRWADAATAFAAYCAASSAAYLVNDVLDREADRAHPLKQRRPVARGELSVRAALMLAALLAALAVALATALGYRSLALLGFFAGLQAAYTMFLKHVVLADVLTIAALFVVRAAAGAVAVQVPISAWLLGCTALLALFLALGKRRGELVLVESRATPGRRVLSMYSLGALDRLVTIVATTTIVVYAAYTVSAHDARALPATIPFVAFGVFRYVYLLRRRGLGEEPDQVLVSDKPILVSVGLWVAICAVVLAFG
jgi:4-hydroxybenzoate polyprenyltransferase